MVGAERREITVAIVAPITPQSISSVAYKGGRVRRVELLDPANNPLE